MHPLIVLTGVGVLLHWAFDERDKKMPAIQKQFDDFHAAIKLDEDDEKANLRKKRDNLIDDLRSHLPDDVPAFEHFHQGSYSMHTGVVPLDGNYDIDVGIIFDCQKDKYPDPVALKKKVRDALDRYGRTVNIRRPCVTVNYLRDGKTEYHVDLAVYAKRDDGLLDLAKGKENSDESKRIWEVSDPKRLTELICKRFDDAADRDQYRRCIRFLKRWRDVKFGSGAPLSIALTVAAYRWFRPNKTTNGTYIDLLALKDWVNAMLSHFSTVWTDEGMHDRLNVTLPVTPNVDVMSWMTRLQMETFKSRLTELRNALQKAYDETLPEESAKVLAKQFGDKFPIPEKSATARSVIAPAIGTGTSA